MIVISHRINTIAQLKSVSKDFGVEVDVRSYGDRLILHHEPLVQGVDFERYLDSYRHKFLIVNTKIDAVEEPILKLLKERNIQDFFFLDLSFPAIIRLARKKESRLALRWSEYEPWEACRVLRGKADWIWMDCFTKYPVLPKGSRKKSDFRFCAVAPELQGRSPTTPQQRSALLKKYTLDAVCTKEPEMWMRTWEKEGNR